MYCFPVAVRHLRQLRYAHACFCSQVDYWVGHGDHELVQGLCRIYQCSCTLSDQVNYSSSNQLFSFFPVVGNHALFYISYSFPGIFNIALITGNYMNVQMEYSLPSRPSNVYTYIITVGRVF